MFTAVPAIEPIEKYLWTCPKCQNIIHLNALRGPDQTAYPGFCGVCNDKFELDLTTAETDPEAEIVQKQRVRLYIRGRGSGTEVAV